jgi:hypothetical protein
MSVVTDDNTQPPCGVDTLSSPVKDHGRRAGERARGAVGVELATKGTARSPAGSRETRLLRGGGLAAFLGAHTLEW